MPQDVLTKEGMINMTRIPQEPDELDTILKAFIAKHADGFFGNGTVKDAIAIRSKAKAAINQYMLDTFMELMDGVPKHPFMLQGYSHDYIDPDELRKVVKERFKP